MKNIKEYLLVALAFILGAIALLKLTRGDLLYVPVAEVNMTQKAITTAYPPAQPLADTKEHDPLGILGTTLHFTPPPRIHPTHAQLFGKTYPIHHNTITIGKKITKPLQITLIEKRRYCAIPKEAIVHIHKESFVLTKKGVRKVSIANVLGDEIYLEPPCPTMVAIGNDLAKRVKESLPLR